MLFIRSRSILSVMLVIVLMMSLLSGCQPITPEADKPQINDEKTDLWVNDQIILLGSHQAVEQVVSELEVAFVEGVEPIEVGQLIVNDYLENPDQFQNLELLPALIRLIFDFDLSPDHLARIQKGDFVARVVDLSKQRISVSDTIEKIDSIRRERFEDYDKGFVFAQPNFWLTPAQAQPQTVCQQIGGAPTPHTIGGGAYGDPQGTASLPEFEQQPAFLQLTDGDPSALQLNNAGKDVTIAIFDTSPFSGPNDGAAFGIDEVTIRPSQTQSAGPATIKNEHGLFVASLARAIAPNSFIELVRVLDTNTCGVVFDLNGALHTLLMKKNPEGKIDKQGKMVINFSLVYKLGNQPNAAKDYLTSLLVKIGADRPNTIIVAATGNGGTWNTQPPASLYPAAHFSVTRLLAVSSTNPNQPSGTLSCFSNAGIVSAPGGEGDMPTCSGPSIDPIENVIGRTTSGYAYWSGTSFAAPIVSGLAARCLSNGDNGAVTLDNLDQPALGAMDNPVNLAMCP